MDDIIFIDEAECARRLSVTVQTVARWRKKKNGIPAIVGPSGRTIRYNWSAVLSWLDRAQPERAVVKKTEPKPATQKESAPQPPPPPPATPETPKKNDLFAAMREGSGGAYSSPYTLGHMHNPKPEPKKKSIKWTGENTDEVMEFINDHNKDQESFEVEDDRILVSGIPFANVGEWIVVGSSGLESIDETEYAERNHKGELE